MHRRLLFLMVVGLLCSSTLSAASPDPAGLEFYENKIRPLFADHCASCHSAKAKKVRGGLSLDTRSEILKGGDTGPAVVPGKPDDSLLIKAVKHLGDLKMPSKGKLPDRLIADLSKWVQMGAPAPEGKTTTVAGIDWTKAREFWSFQPVHRPNLPDVKNSAWLRNPIDRFILARLEEKGLLPVSTAEHGVLLRRTTFDLTGLPPTQAEIDAFLADTRPGAYERVVDRLLSSPAYGERWGRYWLDVARYAEDQAHTFGVKPNTNAWRYRDWVINALNADLPYNRFVKYQIAADLTSDASVADRAALGFFGLGAQYYKNTDAARATADELDDRVDTLARGFLGLTVSCARCHDHKYDPIPTQDYYSLAGVFHSSRLSTVPLSSKEEADRYQAHQKRMQDADREVKEFVKAEKERIARDKSTKVGAYLVAAWKLRSKQVNRKQLAEQGLEPAVIDRVGQMLQSNNRMIRNVTALDPLRKFGTGKDKEVPAQVTEAAKGLQEQLVRLVNLKESELKGQNKNLVNVFFGEKGPFAPTDAELNKVLSPESKSKRQDLQAKLDQLKRDQPPTPPMAHGIAEATPADMKVFIRGNPATQGAQAPRRFLRVLSEQEPTKFTQGSGRLELASAIINPENPLTARVIVNRIWAHHFGRGIVNTPSNFGALGERPTHPELLDWLASELVSSGWSLKHIHRLILTSAVYRLSSERNEENVVRDPDNQYLWRMNRRRLDIESWRDALLAVSGELDGQFGGQTLDLGSDSNRRRTVYAKISRHELNGLLRLFDFPDANITSSKRTETTVPQQQLFVMNSPFMLARTRGLSARIEKATPEVNERIKMLYQVLYARSPSTEEVQLAREYLSSPDVNDESSRNQLTRFQRYTQVLLAGNEFLYID